MSKLEELLKKLLNELDTTTKNDLAVLRKYENEIREIDNNLWVVFQTLALSAPIKKRKDTK